VTTNCRCTNWKAAKEVNLELAVRRYYAAGLRPVLLWGLLPGGKCACEDPNCNGSAGKHPTAAQWQSRRFALETLLRELTLGPRNVGLAMGAQPRGDVLVAVDCDGPDYLLRALEERMGCYLPPTLYSLTRKGCHLLYSVPGGVVIGNRAKLLGNLRGTPDVDLRGEHGQIVAPPSLHASGHVYQWGNRLPIAELPSRAVDWLTAKPPVPVVRRELEPRDRDTAYFRAARYMSRCPPAVSGQGGHVTTFTTAKKLVDNFRELTESDYWDLLVRWNATCEPPWSERELRHKLSEAIRSVT